MSFLPGMAALPLSESFTKFKKVAEATSFGQTIAVPAVTRPGDLLVLWDVAMNDSGDPASITPAGLTTHVDLLNGAADARAMLSTGMATLAMLGGNLTGMNGSFSSVKCLYVFRPNAPVDSYVIAAVKSATGGLTNPDAATLSSQVVAPALAVAGYFSFDASSNVTFTPAADGQISLSDESILTYKLFNSSPQDVLLDYGGGTSTTWETYAGLMITGLVKAPVSSVTQVHSATSAGETIAVPAGVVKGDILVLVDRAASPGGAASVVPSGFSVVLSTYNSGAGRQIMSFKLADGSEASTSLTGMVGSTYTDKVLLVFRGDKVSRALFTKGETHSMSDAVPSNCQLVSAPAEPVIAVASYGSSLPSVDRDLLPVGEDGEVGTLAERLFVKWKIFNGAPSNITEIDMPDSGADNCLQATWLKPY